MPKRWVEERRKDYFYRKAKAEGYRSRAAYKLLQANRSYRFIEHGNAVVDLGCAPGGWLQAASQLAGPNGFVLGVDIKPIKPLGSPNVKFLVGDISDPDIPDKILDAVGRKLDVVLSDVSPNISGVWNLDHARQIDLAKSATLVAKSTLRKDGDFFVKVFDGPLLKDFISELKGCFREVRIFKPKASKARSSELYISCKSFLGSG